MKNDRLMISGSAFALVVQAVLEKGVTARFKATGSSMTPTIRNNDVLSISPYKENRPKVGDVVALLDRIDNRIIIHRIIKQRENMFLLKGDGLWRSDGFFPREWIAGGISAVERNGDLISTERLITDRIILMSKLRLFWPIKILFKLKNRVDRFFGINIACV
jgi:signal peptidase I